MYNMYFCARVILLLSIAYNDGDATIITRQRESHRPWYLQVTTHILRAFISFITHLCTIYERFFKEIWSAMRLWSRVANHTTTIIDSDDQLRITGALLRALMAPFYVCRHTMSPKRERESDWRHSNIISRFALNHIRPVVLDNIIDFDVFIDFAQDASMCNFY